MATASIERKLTAILSADVKSYSRLMGADEVGTLRTLTAHREVTDSLIQQHFVFAHLVLASCYAELGRLEEARAEAAEVLRINPNFSLEVWRQMIPYKDPAVLERFLVGLRRAGLK